jgi:hypothetical protein
LVRQRIDDARVHSEQRIKLVGNLNAFRFCSEEEDLRLSVEGVCVTANLDEPLQFLFSERTPYLSSGLNTYAFHEGSASKRGYPTNFYQFGGIET